MAKAKVGKAGICTGPGPCDTKPFSASRTDNWVARRGGLPPYVRAIAHALMRDKGMPESKAIAIAVATVKKPGKNTKPNTKAQRAGATARWEAMRASKSGDEFETTFEITKLDKAKQQVFGWAYITHDQAGKLNVDKSGEFIDDPNELESMAYDFVLESRQGGDLHERTADNKAVVKSTMIESIVFTPEKQKALGIPEGTLPIGWFAGFQVHDKNSWNAIEKGERLSFSVHGTGVKKEVDPSEFEEEPDAAVH